MDTVLLKFLISILAASSATELNLAQGLLRCLVIEDSSTRLECYDTLGKAVGQQSEVPVPAPPPIPPVIDLSTEKLAALQNGSSLSGQLTEQQQMERFNTIFHPTKEDLVDAFGAEQLRVEDRPPVPEQKLEQLAVDIVKVSEDAQGKYVVELGNGQLWQQKRDARIYFNNNELPLESIISRNFMGGYRLALTKRNQGMFVERVR